MRNFYKKENIGLIATRLNRQKSTGYFWISKSIIERHILDTAGDSTSYFPLYIYPEFNGQQTIDQTIVRVPNLKMEFVSKISKSLELTFTDEKEDNCKSFAPLDLLDYIYAVLHSPSYREKYKEFLKIDFPRVPYATDADKFWKLVVLGKELREIHLLESPKVEEFLTGYPEEGDNIEEHNVCMVEAEIVDEDYYDGRTFFGRLRQPVFLQTLHVVCRSIYCPFWNMLQMALVAGNRRNSSCRGISMC